MRLMLVEFFRGALRRNERSMLFPFLKGLASRRGETLWLCYGGDIAHRKDGVPGRELYAALPAGDLRSLAARLKKFRPTHVVTSDALSPEAAALLPAGVKRLVMPLPGDLPEGKAWRGDAARCGWLLEWLGVPDAALAGRFLVEAAEPDYAAVLANPAARSAKPQITLVSGALCLNRRTVERNPHFAGVDLTGLVHRGCSFCPSATRPALTSPRAPLLPLLERQLRAVRRTAGRRDAGRYEFFDIRAFWKFDEVFKLVLRLKLPPSVFLFNPRLDDVLRLRPKIERLLPALAKAGHEVRILSMGVENFSERENERFNKDISAAQVDEFLALMKRWGASFPGVFLPFRAGSPVVEIGLILFTPWTTLDDLRVNFTRASERGFPERGYWLYSILLLEPSTPLFRLARHEKGVLAARFPDRGQVYGLFKNEGELADVQAWRFKDKRTADFFALCVRVCAADREGEACGFFRGDEAFARAARLYAAARARAGVTPLGVARELLDLLEAAPARRDREALLARAIERAAARLAPAPAAPAAPDGRAAALAKAGRALKDGVALESAAPDEPEPGAVRLNLLVDGRKLSLALLPSAHAGPSFFESAGFKVIYLAEEPTWSGKDLSAAADRVKAAVAALAAALAP